MANKIVRLSDLLKEKKEQISLMCTDDQQKQEFFQSVGLVFADNQNLQECLKTEPGQRSVTQALKMVASTGLSLNPQKQEATLVAYKGKCTYQIMKEGYVELAMRTGRVQYIGGDVVRENDSFSVNKSMDGDHFDFAPARKDRGDIDGFFAGIVYMDDNNQYQKRVEYMTVDQMEEHRDKYRADKWSPKDKQKNGAWSTSFEGMARKTVMKRLLVNTKISDKLREHIANEVQNYSDVYGDEPIEVEATISPSEEIAADIENEQQENNGRDLF